MNGVAIIIIVSLISLIGDVVLKKASDNGNMYLLGLGVFLYAIDAVMWFFAYKYSKFSTVGVLYSLLIIFASITIGILFFKEKIVFKEVVGIIFGLVSLLLLTGK